MSKSSRTAIAAVSLTVKWWRAQICSSFVARRSVLRQLSLKATRRDRRSKSLSTSKEYIKRSSLSLYGSWGNAQAAKNYGTIQ